MIHQRAAQAERLHALYGALRQMLASLLVMFCQLHTEKAFFRCFLYI